MPKTIMYDGEPLNVYEPSECIFDVMWEDFNGGITSVIVAQQDRSVADYGDLTEINLNQLPPYFGTASAESYWCSDFSFKNAPNPQQIKQDMQDLGYTYVNLGDTRSIG